MIITERAGGLSQYFYENSALFFVRTDERPFDMMQKDRKKGEIEKIENRNRAFPLAAISAAAAKSISSLFYKHPKVRKNE